MISHIVAEILQKTMHYCYIKISLLYQVNRVASIGALKDLGKAVNGLEKALNYVFKEKDFLLQSLIREDVFNDSTKPELNKFKTQESIALIGDAALDLVIFEFFYNESKDIIQKGELDNKRQFYTSNKSLTHFAKSINLQGYIIWSFNDKGQKVWEKSNKVLATCFEALIGAIHLDGGIPAVKQVLTTIKFFEYK